MDLAHALGAVSVFQGFVLLFLLYRTNKEKRAINALFDAVESILEILKLTEQVYLTETTLSKKLSIKVAVVKKKNCCNEPYDERVVQLLLNDEVISQERLV